LGPAVPNPCQDLEDRCQLHIRTPAKTIARLAQPRCNATATLCSPPLTAMRASQPPIACSHATATALSPIKHPSKHPSTPCSLLAAPNQSRLTCRGLLCLPPPGLGCHCRCPVSPACAACAAQTGGQTHQPWRPQGQASAGCTQNGSGTHMSHSFSLTPHPHTHMSGIQNISGNRLLRHDVKHILMVG
jgi:hypothetical protein